MEADRRQTLRRSLEARLELKQQSILEGSMGKDGSDILKE
jgi:hypothetical protein